MTIAARQKLREKSAGPHTAASQKTAIQYDNSEFSIGSYLGGTSYRRISRGLGLRQKLALALNGYAYITTAQPPAFSGPTEIYLVKGRNGFYLSYRQGYGQEFYEPEGRA